MYTKSTTTIQLFFFLGPFMGVDVEGHAVHCWMANIVYTVVARGFIVVARGFIVECKDGPRSRGRGCFGRDTRRIYIYNKTGTRGYRNSLPSSRQ